MAAIARFLPNVLKNFSPRNYNPLFGSLRFLDTDISKTADESDFSIVSSRPSLPLITSRQLEYPDKYIQPRQAWLINMDTVEEEKLGLIDLHPEVFAVMPRMDLIYRNLHWQKTYRKVDFKTDLSRAEMRGGGRKPWRQKGTGRARHGSIRSPIFIGGGKAHGKRGPKSYFYMLPYSMRVHGFISMLSSKFAQDDLFVVDSLEIPTQDPKFIDDLVEKRKWGISVLFINDCDVMPRNITLATDDKETITLMPYYGLNVYSMLKYDTLVLTLEALNKIEERLLFSMHRSDTFDLHRKFDRFRFNRSVFVNSGPQKIE